MSGLRAAPVLDTPRLRLRPFAEADHPAYAAMCADAEVMRCIGPGQVKTSAEAWRSMDGTLDLHGSPAQVFAALR
jgi:RimJ/RimL family protein N-acetyltransferase